MPPYVDNITKYKKKVILAVIIQNVYIRIKTVSEYFKRHTLLKDISFSKIA